MKKSQGTTNQVERRETMFFMKRKYRELYDRMQTEIEDGTWATGELSVNPVTESPPEPYPPKKQGLWQDFKNAFREVRKLRGGRG